VREPGHGLTPRLSRRFGRLALSVAGQQWAHECPFVAEHAVALVSDAVSFEEVGMGAEQGTVLLVGSEAGATEQGESLVACTFGRKEIAVMRAAMRINELDPPAAEALEGVDLRGIDHVLNDTSDDTSA
jgi:hypothetical protein